MSKKIKTICYSTPRNSFFLQNDDNEIMEIDLQGALEFSKQVREIVLGDLRNCEKCVNFKINEMECDYCDEFKDNFVEKKKTSHSVEINGKKLTFEELANDTFKVKYGDKIVYNGSSLLLATNDFNDKIYDCMMDLQIKL